VSGHRFGRLLVGVVAVSLCSGFVVPAAGVSAGPQSVSAEPGAGMSSVEAPAIGGLEGLLPPGARHVVSVFRVFRGLHARNTVYREARHVQRELRQYYEARIAKAQEQIDNREQLGLSDSQVRAYTRAGEMLKAERDVAVGITEFEKKAAKYGFESAFKRELVAALVRVPKVQAVFAKVKSAIGDLQSTISAAQTAIATGNPAAALLGEINEKLAKVERAGALTSLVSGRAGANISKLAERVRGALAPLEGAIDDVVGVGDDAIAELEALSDALSEQSDAPRSPRAGLDVALGDEPMIDKIATVAGASPTVDVAADLIARQVARHAAGQSGQPQVQLRRMRDRVHAAILGGSLERIADICGRAVGLARRVQQRALEAGELIVDTSNPCTMYGNPEALQALIDADRAANATTTTITTEDTDGGDATPPVDGSVDGLEYTFVGTFQLAGEEPVTWNGTFVVTDGVVSGNGTSSFSAAGDCEALTVSAVEVAASATYDITGRATDTSVTIELTNIVGGVTSFTGDRSKLCDDLAYDFADSLVVVPWGTGGEVGILEVPLEGGSQTIDFDDGFVFTADITLAVAG